MTELAASIAEGYLLIVGVLMGLAVIGSIVYGLFASVTGQ